MIESSGEEREPDDEERVQAELQLQLADVVEPTLVIVGADAQRVERERQLETMLAATFPDI